MIKHYIISVVFTCFIAFNAKAQLSVVDSLFRAEVEKRKKRILQNSKMQIDSCQQKFIKSIMNDIYNEKEEWIVVRIGDSNRNWSEIVSSKLFYDCYLNSYQKSYQDTAIKDYEGYMIMTELKYFTNNSLDNSFDKENKIYKHYYRGYKKDSIQFNVFIKEGLSDVLRKYFNKKQEFLEKYRSIKMQLFWYLFDNKVRVVTLSRGQSYYILYDCQTTFFPIRTYAAHF